MRQIYQGDPNLPSNFQMNPDKVPIGEYPINRQQPILDFSQVCYNAAVEFVDGFDPDAVRNSTAGKYCKNQVNNLILDIGKNPCQVNIPVPVINLRPKFFQVAMHNHKNPEKALQQCLVDAENFNRKGGEYNPDWAILKHDDTVLYLVRETKGTKDFEQLRNSEANKIRCGRKHFEELEVDFQVVTSASEV